MSNTMDLDRLFASIPSPSFDTVSIGPLDLRMYGLAIAIGVIVAVGMATKRWEERGGHPDDVSTMAIWAVPAGVIGSRVYHVATDWKSYRDDWWEALNITQGGLGIPGGIIFGVLAGVAVATVRNLPRRPLFDVMAPAIPVGQAIGRLGNWFNQEVFGRPTELPWGLEIDPANRPADHPDASTFHPTFLYEGLWNLALAYLLIRLDRQRRLRPGQLFTLYAFGYAVGRLWVEMLRADPASLVAGVRVNIWMSLIVGTGALLVFAWLQRGPAPALSAHRSPSSGPADSADSADPGGAGADDDHQHTGPGAATGQGDLGGRDVSDRHDPGPAADPDPADGGGGEGGD